MIKHKAARGRGNQGDWGIPLKDIYGSGGEQPQHKANNDAVRLKKAAKRARQAARGLLK